MTRAPGDAPRRRLLPAALLLGGLTLGGVAVAGVASAGHHHAAPPAAVSAASLPPGAPGAPGAAADPLAADIARLQTALRARPDDYASLADLGLDYVQQAKITVDPAYYPKARGVLARSLALNPTSNVAAMAGEAAYLAALHDFTGARSWALRGLRVDRYNATLFGSLADADTQLGDYTGAASAVQHMLNLDPGVPALTRAEYVYELRGELDGARALLVRALAAAQIPSDRAFVHQIASDVAFNSGHPAQALAEARAGRAADPQYTSLLEQQARAEAALGDSAAAVADYEQLVSAAPQPQYLVAYGEYLDSLGRPAQARQQYDVFGVEARLFAANGVTLDTDPTLFYADHGDPATALRYGRAGLAIRPFVEMQDAYAWALHVTGQDRAALPYLRRAAALGTRNALFFFHAGLIHQALGERAAARAALRTALQINPYFSPRYAPVARHALALLGAAG